MAFMGFYGNIWEFKVKYENLGWESRAIYENLKESRRIKGNLVESMVI